MRQNDSSDTIFEKKIFVRTFAPAQKIRKSSVAKKPGRDFFRSKMLNAKSSGKMLVNNATEVIRKGHKINKNISLKISSKPPWLKIMLIKIILLEADMVAR